MNIMVILALIISIAVNSTSLIIIPKNANSVEAEKNIIISAPPVVIDRSGDLVIFEAVEISAIFIKFLGILFVVLEIILERENSVEYEQFLRQSKENCLQRLSDLTCLDENYENSTPEHFVSNCSDTKIFREANLWAQLQKFLTREFQKLLYSRGKMSKPVTRRNSFEYFYCSDLSKWAMRSIHKKDVDGAEERDLTVNEKTVLNGNSGPVAFREVPCDDSY